MLAEEYSQNRNNIHREYIKEEMKEDEEVEGGRGEENKRRFSG